MKLLLVMLVVACVNPKPPVYHPDVIAIVDTDSDKAIQIVYDERMHAHEARAVPASAVAAALLASGQFLDDDVRALADPIARHLETMQPEEALRIVGWAADAPRYYYVLIHNNRLQIIYYAGSTQSDSYSAALPTDAVSIVAPPEPNKPETPQPEIPPDAGVQVPPTGPAQVADAQPRPKRKRAPVANALPLLTEAEARRKIRELDEALTAGLITQVELKSRRKEILARL